MALEGIFQVSIVFEGRFLPLVSGATYGFIGLHHRLFFKPLNDPALKMAHSKYEEHIKQNIKKEKEEEEKWVLPSF